MAGWIELERKAAAAMDQIPENPSPSRGPGLLACCIIFTAMSTSFVGARFYRCARVRKFAIEDILIVIALVSLTSSLTMAILLKSVALWPCRNDYIRPGIWTREWKTLLAAQTRGYGDALQTQLAQRSCRMLRFYDLEAFGRHHTVTAWLWKDIPGSDMYHHGYRGPVQHVAIDRPVRRLQRVEVLGKSGAQVHSRV